MDNNCSKEEFEAALTKVLLNARKFGRAVQVHGTNGGELQMKDVTVYLWVDVWGMDYCLDPEFWEHPVGCPSLHVSLKNPTEDEGGLSPLTDEDKLGENKNFILLKRKIYLLPPFLKPARSEEDIYDVYFESEGYNLEWDPQRNTVVAKNHDGVYPLIPAD